MSRDGLIPPFFGNVHPRFKTPHTATILTGLFVGLGSALASLEEMADLCNIGTLSAFILVCAGVLVMRYREPDRPRAFRAPFVPLFPILGIAACLYLILGLPHSAWARFGIWLAIGMVCFFSYGYRRSRLAASK
jgi:APA family basic amino acid/polyamine antiporter